MKEIIDKHRIEIWKKALSILDDMGFICIAIRKSTKEICGKKVEKLHDIELSEFIEQYFPELYKYKDKYTYGKSDENYLIMAGLEEHHIQQDEKRRV